MASSSAAAGLLLAFFFAYVRVLASQELKASVSCLDCTRLQPLSGIRVAVECAGAKALQYAITKEDGSFEAKLPTTPTPTLTPCHAMLLGGPSQICAHKHSMVSKIVRVKGSFTLSTPLAFSSKCSSVSSATKDSNPGLESSKTINLPLPPEWGFAPSSYYFPYVPIIGVP